MTAFEINQYCAEADFNRITGIFNKAQHSSNVSPNLSNRGISDFTLDFQRMNFTYARTHDWALWNTGQRIIDTHFIFPLMHLDPADPQNYYFDATDEILKITQDAGSRIFYRLGTSIEHSGLRPDQKHFNSLPPEDYEKYAEVLAGIIRHYTQGWANGFHYDIKYWEIWNEAENNPTCWRGPYEEFIKFFVIVLKRLKAEFPELKIGGPAAAYFHEERIRNILKACKAADISPDFISWHSYQQNPQELIAAPEKMKKIIHEEGFDCETAVTEWHYLVSWDGLQSNMSVESRKYAIEGPTGLCGIDSAVYNLAVLCGWQETDLDLACYYGASPRGDWGFLDQYGGYNKNFHSMCMFGKLLGCFENRIAVKRLDADTYLQGGVSPDGRKGMLLVADYRSKKTYLELKISGMENARIKAEYLDQSHDLFLCDATYENGILRLPKKTAGSGAFLVYFERD